MDWECGKNMPLLVTECVCVWVCVRVCVYMRVLTDRMVSADMCVQAYKACHKPAHTNMHIHTHTHTHASLNTDLLPQPLCSGAVNGHMTTDQKSLKHYPRVSTQTISTVCG